jgi:hypothetical protein
LGESGARAEELGNWSNFRSNEARDYEVSEEGAATLAAGVEDAAVQPCADLSPLSICATELVVHHADINPTSIQWPTRKNKYFVETKAEAVDGTWRRTVPPSMFRTSSATSAGSPTRGLSSESGF